MARRQLGEGDLALVGGRLVDGTGAPPRECATVLIRNGVVSEVVDGEVTPDGYRVVDARGRTVMPGLIDAHVHLSSLTLPAPPRGELAYEANVRPYAQAAASQAMIEGGITTARDLGSNGRELFALRRAIGAELCPGPRLVLCGQIVSPTSPGGRLFSSMYRQADGPDEVRKAVREQIQQGADLIKIMTTGALTVPREAVEPAQMTRAGDRGYRRGVAPAGLSRRLACRGPARHRALGRRRRRHDRARRGAPPRAPSARPHGRAGDRARPDAERVRARRRERAVLLLHAEARRPGCAAARGRAQDRGRRARGRRHDGHGLRLASARRQRE